MSKIVKLTQNTCPKCGGAALEYPVCTEYLVAAPNTFIETLLCKDCDYEWNEFYEKRYLGYEDEDGIHPRVI